VSVAKLSDIAGVQQGVEFPEGPCRSTDDLWSKDISPKQYYRV
jgi:hypothetical protein